jgi:Cu(I)/Ag(I) efflux system membrane fusion protein
MHPQIVQDHEGTCPICGMTLVAVDGLAAAAAGIPGLVEVVIDPARQQLIGLRTVKVDQGPLGGAWRTSGRVVADETRVRKVTVKVEGFVERLFVDVTGQPVAKGQPLLSLYSPDFVSAQQEYLLALKTRAALKHGELSDSGEDLVASAKRRLLLWDVAEADLLRLEQGGEVKKSLVLLSPITGIVTDKKVVQGQRVGPAEALFEVTDLSRVWVMADAYEPDLGRVKVGQAATFAATAFPGRTFSGRIAFIDPVLDPKTRTARLRLELANPKGDLKPELFGEVTIQGSARKGLSVPQDAVLETGARAIVFVARGDGHFQPREVKVGQRSEGRVEIRSGLGEGESVVSGAAFLVDSESSLRAAMAQLQHSH